MEQHIADLNLARLVVYVLLGMVGLLGAIVAFFLKGIYDQFKEVVHDVSQIKRDVDGFKQLLPDLEDGDRVIVTKPVRRRGERT